MLRIAWSLFTNRKAIKTKQKRAKNALRERNAIDVTIRRENRKMTFMGLNTFSRNTTASEPMPAPVKSAKYIVPLCAGWDLKVSAMKRLDRTNGGRKDRESKSGWDRSTILVNGSMTAMGKEIARSMEIVVRFFCSKCNAEAKNPPIPKPNIAMEIARNT
jgi:hypothetical protein